MIRWDSSLVCGGSVSGGGGFLELNLNGDRGDLGDLELKGDRGLSRNWFSISPSAVRGSVSVSGSGFDFLAMLRLVWAASAAECVVARPPRRNPLLSRVKWCTAFQRT